MRCTKALNPTARTRAKALATPERELRCASHAVREQRPRLPASAHEKAGHGHPQPESWGDTRGGLGDGVRGPAHLEHGGGGRGGRSEAAGERAVLCARAAKGGGRVRRHGGGRRVRKFSPSAGLCPHPHARPHAALPFGALRIAQPVVYRWRHYSAYGRTRVKTPVAPRWQDQAKASWPEHTCRSGKPWECFS